MLLDSSSYATIKKSHDGVKKEIDRGIDSDEQMWNVFRNENPLWPILVGESIVRKTCFESGWDEFPDMAKQKEPNDQDRNSSQALLLGLFWRQTSMMMVMM